MIPEWYEFSMILLVTSDSVNHKSTINCGLEFPYYSHCNTRTKQGKKYIYAFTFTLVFLFIFLYVESNLKLKELVAKYLLRFRTYQNQSDLVSPAVDC